MPVVESDFNEINWYAGRANAAYLSASEIQEKHPNTVHVSSLESIDVQYFLETFSISVIERGIQK
jgi:triacylglycerol lipase